MKRSEKKVVVNILLFFASWIIWFNFSRYMALSVFMRSEWISRLSVVCTSLMLSAVTIYFANKSRRVSLGDWKALGKLFSGLAVIFVMTFWNAPEVFIYLTAKDVVNNVVEFSIRHPGPTKGKHSHCQAGIQYYDDYLLRKIELCANDENIDVNANYIYVQRKVSRYGVDIQSYSFVR